MANRIANFIERSSVVDRILQSAAQKASYLAEQGGAPTRQQILDALASERAQLMAIRDELQPVHELKDHAGCQFILEAMHKRYQVLADEILSPNQPMSGLAVSNPGSAMVKQVYMAAWRDFVALFAGFEKEYGKTVRVMSAKTEQLMDILRGDNGNSQEVEKH